MIRTLSQNIYLPRPALIKEIIVENSQIKTFSLVFTDEDYNKSFTYEPGQFMMVSVPHCGEVPISFSSTPSRPGSLTLSVRKAGKLTNAMHSTLEQGMVIGLRGPYGRPFPMEALKGKNLLFVAGGIGLAPLRSVINFCMDQKNDFGDITILYGSRMPSDIAFKKDITVWKQQPATTCLLTVDEAEPGWDGHTGVVTTLFDKISVAPSTTVALICGPPLMIRFVIAQLSMLGLKDEDIITTMERHMKCGIGICRHCHMDSKLICVDGPVFNRAELKKLDVTELHT